MPSSKADQLPSGGSFSLILISFLLIIFAVPIFWGIRGNDPQDISIIEGRLLTRFTPRDYDLRKVAGRLRRGNVDAAEDALKNLINTRSDQVMIEKAASDQFPLRMPLIKSVKAVEQSLIGLSYALLPDPAIPADMDSNLYVMRNGSAIIYGPKAFNAGTRDIIDEHIRNYAAMIEAFPGINFLAYQVDELAYSPAHPLNPYFPEPDMGRSLAYFEQHLPKGLTLSKMNLGGLDEHLQYFYKTDIHWNIYGIMRGYSNIYQLLEQVYPGISTPLEFGPVVTFAGIDFVGTARASFYPVPGEDFAGVDMELPEHKIYSFGEEITSYEHSDQYFAGQYSTEPYIYHFTEFFGNNQAYLEYVFENGTGRNLLIVGDSFKIPLQPLLASHYHHTYVVNPSLYRNFDLSEFLDQNPVDDIIFVGGNNVLFLDPQWAIKP